MSWTHSAKRRGPRPTIAAASATETPGSMDSASPKQSTRCGGLSTDQVDATAPSMRASGTQPTLHKRFGCSREAGTRITYLYLRETAASIRLRRKTTMQRRVVSRGAIAVACGLWLAGTSTAAAQTVSARPPAPPPGQFPRPESSVVEVPELLRFQFVPKFLAGIPVGRSGRRSARARGRPSISRPA